jgi:hypothetical protein
MAAQLLRPVDKLQANTLLLLLLPCIQTLDASLSLAFFMKIEFWVLFRIRLATRNQICNMQAKLLRLLQFKLLAINFYLLAKPIFFLAKFFWQNLYLFLVKLFSFGKTYIFS